MLYILVISAAFSLALTLPLILTPITLGVWIFILALLSASLVTFFSSSWFGLILFIIYIGGILVIFSYFVATAPNQKIRLSAPASILILLFITASSVLFINQHSYFLSPIINTTLTFNSFASLYLPTYIPVLIFLAALLLLALILVVKVADRKEGPLRPFN